MVKDWKENAIILVAIFGIIVSAYGISLHYSQDGESFCNISESFNCDIVNQSEWATFFGIPVSILGLLAYLFVALLIVKRKTIQDILAFSKQDFFQYFFIFTGVMLVFQGYLTYIEAFVLKTYCLVCLGSQLAVLLLFLLAGWLWFKDNNL